MATNCKDWNRSAYICYVFILDVACPSAYGEGQLQGSSMALVAARDWYFISHSHDSLPHAQLLLDKLVTMLLNANREIDSSEIVFHVIYLLLEKTDLKISDDIRDSLFQREQWKWFLNGFLRKHEHGIVAWKLLESEVIQIDGNLLSYIQSKTGLLQRNVVSQLAVLQGKEEGDIECARNTLEIATKIV
eukprot:649570_1